jgi:hypothetical protein
MFACRFSDNELAAAFDSEEFHLGAYAFEPSRPHRKPTHVRDAAGGVARRFGDKYGPRPAHRALGEDDERGSVDAVAADRDAAAVRLSDAVKNATVPDDQASQTGAQRIWTRLRQRLDAAKSPAEKAAAVQDLVAGAEGLTLGTLQEELPDYLQAAGAPTGWLHAAFAARLPEAADAAAEGAKLTKAHAVLQHNHQALTRAIWKDVDVPSLMDPTQVDAAPYVNPTGG